ncbi:uncharacterized protein B0H18DRAFT_339587 [Fomitopsis serialis]|uniref:uncharacterized protein n=1 Tax=Fomitopsis serialis TaxID=139415 RepID=UPI002007B729|nr:uncharacterized protein B0H18DRAFT_339587 [Neoantrodia serialis]KAH9926382.1 hypothetical protein B0H18DRAFT_339587 [Neoantrodia serialis]
MFGTIFSGNLCNLHHPIPYHRIHRALQQIDVDPLHVVALRDTKSVTQETPSSRMSLRCGRYIPTALSSTICGPSGLMTSGRAAAANNPLTLSLVTSDLQFANVLKR